MDKNILELAEKLDKIAEKRKLALDESGVGHWDWDIEKDILWWSDNLYKIYEVSEEEFTGKMSFWYSNLTLESLERYTKELKRTLLSEKPFFCKFNIITRKGEKRQILAVGNVIKNYMGEPARMVGINVLVPEKYDIVIKPEPD